MCRYGLFLIVSVLFFGACSDEPSLVPPVFIDFRGRQVDIQPFLGDYHYFFASYEAGQLFFFHDEEEQTLLQAIPLRKWGGTGSRKTLAPRVDFSAFNAWGMRYNPGDGCFYWTGDDDQRERTNLWRLDPRRGQPEQLTDLSYVYSWNWNATRDTIALVGREEDRGALYLLDLRAGVIRRVSRDRPDLTFSWGTPAWLPDGRSIALTALRRGDRRFGNIVQVDIPSGHAFLLTDSSRRRTFPTVYPRALPGQTILYFSDENGFRNLYTYQLPSGIHRQVTSFRREVKTLTLAAYQNRQCLLLITSSPAGDNFHVLDPADGSILMEKNTDQHFDLLDSRRNRLILRRQSVRSPPGIIELHLSEKGFEFTEILQAREAVRSAIAGAEVEQISFPTFDLNSFGQPRYLSGFLYHPVQARPSAEKMLFVRSFYGGQNTFDAEAQLLAAAGFYVFSPAVRGSSGLGRSFAELNDGDLGGDEVRDLLSACRYLSDSLGIPSGRTALFGSSHGGYVTLRALTWPAGDTLAFPFGYGISHAGMSDLPAFYRHTNIPGWFIQEAGNPTRQPRLRDRSPLYHAANLTGRLLLTHGVNDPRVPIDQSRRLADTLRLTGKPVILLEFPGQGHAVKGRKNKRRWWKAVGKLVGKPEKPKN